MRRDVTAELKELRLHGMVGAWTDLTADRTAAMDSSRWLIEHLLQAEATDRAMRSVRNQLNAAKFPVHRDLAGFDFSSSKADRHLVGQLATLSFTDTAQNVVLIGGSGTGRRIWLPPLRCLALPRRASGRAFIPRSTWSICWSERSRRGAPGGSQCP